jgi:hypothetical protein
VAVGRVGLDAGGGRDEQVAGGVDRQPVGRRGRGDEDAAVGQRAVGGDVEDVDGRGLGVADVQAVGRRRQRDAVGAIGQRAAVLGGERAARRHSEHAHEPQRCAALMP